MLTRNNIIMCQSSLSNINLEIKLFFVTRNQNATFKQVLIFRYIKVIFSSKKGVLLYQNVYIHCNYFPTSIVVYAN